MTNYRIFETEQFQKDLVFIIKAGQKSVVKKFQEIAYIEIKRNPKFGKHIKKLVNWNPETWRYRIGDWRFFYEIDDKRKIIFLIAADHRGSAY